MTNKPLTMTNKPLVGEIQDLWRIAWRLKVIVDQSPLHSAKHVSDAIKRLCCDLKYLRRESLEDMDLPWTPFSVYDD